MDARPKEPSSSVVAPKASPVPVNSDLPMSRKTPRVQTSTRQYMVTSQTQDANQYVGPPTPETN